MTAVSIPSAGAIVAKRYRVQESIGHGSMGVVLAAVDEKTGVTCAIKLLAKQAIPSDTARLVREARALMLLQSAHVVRVFDVDESEEFGPYLVLERLEGYDLNNLPGRKKLSVARAAELMRGVATALVEAHALGIVHRDIKPSNLFVARSADGSEVIKILDFGISKLGETADWHGQPTLTAQDGVLGSPQFISPEQLESPRTVDGRGDLWSVGVVLFRLVTGTYPFGGATMTEIFSAVLRSEIPTLASRGVDAPELQAILDRCIVRDVSRRFENAGLLADALAALAARSVEPHATSTPELVTEVPFEAQTADLERTTHAVASTPFSPSKGWTRRRPAVAGPLVIALALATVVAVVALRSLHAVGGVNATPEASPSSHASAVAADPTSKGLIEMRTSADRPILAVRARGLRRLVIEDRRATLTVTPWTGPFAIEADLVGGGLARAEVGEEGARDVRLVEVEVPSVKPIAHPPLRSPAPRKPAGRTGALPPVAPSATGELRHNPYL